MILIESPYQLYNSQSLQITVCLFFWTLAHLGPLKVVKMDYCSDENFHSYVLEYGESRYQSENSVRLYKITATWSIR